MMGGGEEEKGGGSGKRGWGERDREKRKQSI